MKKLTEKLVGHSTYLAQARFLDRERTRGGRSTAIAISLKAPGRGKAFWNLVRVPYKALAKWDGINPDLPTEVFDFLKILALISDRDLDQMHLLSTAYFQGPPSYASLAYSVAKYIEGVGQVALYWKTSAKSTTRPSRPIIKSWRRSSRDCEASNSEVLELQAALEKASRSWEKSQFSSLEHLEGVLGPDSTLVNSLGGQMKAHHVTMPGSLEDLV